MSVCSVEIYQLIIIVIAFDLWVCENLILICLLILGVRMKDLRCVLTESCHFAFCLYFAVLQNGTNSSSVSIASWM